MSKRSLSDRITLYRWSAAILSVTVVRSVYTLVTDTQPWTGWRVVLWTAYVVLMVAVVRDALYVYRAKKDVHRTLRKITERT